jgi:hypothetical protein
MQRCTPHFPSDGRQRIPALVAVICTPRIRGCLAGARGGGGS